LFPANPAAFVLMIDKHALATISIIGSSLDVLGAFMASRCIPSSWVTLLDVSIRLGNSIRILRAINRRT